MPKILLKEGLVVNRGEKEYLDIAENISKNIHNLKHFRHNLRIKLHNSPLTDAIQYTRSFEKIILDTVNNKNLTQHTVNQKEQQENSLSKQVKNKLLLSIKNNLKIYVPNSPEFLPMLSQQGKGVLAQLVQSACLTSVMSLIRYHKNNSVHSNLKL